MTNLLKLPVYLSLGLLFTMLPIPELMKGCWPNWVVLFIFWLSHFRPKSMLFVWSWVLGLCLDVLQSSLLGVHVIGLLMLSIFIGQYRNKFLLFPLIQQGILVAIATALYVLATQYFYADLNSVYFLIYTLQVAVVTGCLWPWIEYQNKSSLFFVQKKFSQ